MEEKTERDLLDIVRPPLFKRGMTDIQEQDFLQGVTDCALRIVENKNGSIMYRYGYKQQHDHHKKMGIDNER
jgi:hypothetical protein